jgi:hypothetical protein
MPFIQVTCEGTDAPIRHTVSLVGAAAAADELLLEPQPAIPAAVHASTTAAPMVAADLVRFTARSPFPAVLAGQRPPGRRGRCDRIWGRN